MSKIHIKKGDKVSLISLYPDLRNQSLRSISTYLKKKKNVKTKIIFIIQNFYEKYNDEDLKNLIELCKDSNYIGISLTSDFLKKAIITTKELKKKINCKIIWGGIHPFVAPEECLKYADEICIGDGETFFTGENKQLENIDIQADLDFTSQFILKNGKIVQLNEEIFSSFCNNTYYVFTTRGCLFNCSFCINQKLKKIHPRIRIRSINNVIQELLYVKKNLPSFKKVCFSDENICSLDVNYLKEFFRQYKEKINLPFIISVHPLLVTEEKVKIFVDAGLISVKFGIQTGSDKIRKMYNRFEKNEDIINVFNLLKKYKLEVALDFITDNPYESKEDIIESLKLVRKLSPFEMHLFSLVFYKGTKMYEMAKRDNLDIERDTINTAVRNNYLNSLYLFLSHHKISEKAFNFLLNTNLSFAFKYIFFMEHKLLTILKSFKPGMLLDLDMYKRTWYLWKKNYVR